MSGARVGRLVGFGVVLTLVGLSPEPGVAQAPAPAQPRLTRDLTVDAQAVWTTTDLALKPGDRVVFRATGTARCGDQQTFGPAGLPRGFRDLLRVLPLAQAGRGALIGRIGDGDAALPFMIGAAGEMVSTVGGPTAPRSPPPRAWSRYRAWTRPCSAPCPVALATRTGTLATW